MHKVVLRLKDLKKCDLLGIELFLKKLRIRKNKKDWRVYAPALFIGHLFAGVGTGSMFVVT